VEIDNLAKQGNPQSIDFPRVWLGRDNLNFSFSGIKSAVLNYLNSAKMSGQEVAPANVAASFQQAVVEVLVKKSIMACELANCDKLAVAGGVAANSALRAALTAECKKRGISLNIPHSVFCTDNAAMIAAAAYFDFVKGRFAGLGLNAVPSLAL